MMIDDQQLLRNISEYILFLRQNSLRVSVSCLENRWRILYPAFAEMEIHDCPLCDRIKSNAEAAEICFANKRKLIQCRFRSPLYQPCPYGVEEFLVPVLYEGEPILYLHATGYAGADPKSERLFFFRKSRLMRKNPAFAEAYEKEYGKLSASPPSERYVLSALAPLQVLFSLFFENFVKDRIPSDPYDVLNAEILNYIYENYSLPFSPGEMAKELQYSLPHIRYVFRLKNGIPLAKFLLEFRLRQAAVKLKNGSCSVAQAALSSGFQDSNHFSVLFRKKYGISPSRYKKEKG